MCVCGGVDASPTHGACALAAVYDVVDLAGRAAVAGDAVAAVQAIGPWVAVAVGVAEHAAKRRRGALVVVSAGAAEAVVVRLYGVHHHLVKLLGVVAAPALLQPGGTDAPIDIHDVHVLPCANVCAHVLSDVRPLGARRRPVREVAFHAAREQCLLHGRLVVVVRARVEVKQAKLERML